MLPTYARVDLAFERGEGAWLYTAEGERYLDFTSGVAVNALGHAHPDLVKALTEQAQKVWHVSNLYRIPEGERLADRLCAAAFADTVFFQNSGAEALECAVKLARRASISPPPASRSRESRGAILIEPIQGEGGVRVASPTFLRALRQLCDQHDLLLVFDEVQTGIARTGEMFAYERSGVKPDVMALAKALGGGFPIGACLATTEASKGMTVGTHGSTFGGNPLAMAVGNAVLDVVMADGFLEHMRKNALLLKQRLAELKDRHASVIAEVRGEGLLIGLRMIPEASEMVDELRAEKMITVAAGDNVVRLLPPLIIGEKEITEAIGCIDRACARLAKTHARAAKVAS